MELTLRRRAATRDQAAEHASLQSLLSQSIQHAESVAQTLRETQSSLQASGLGLGLLARAPPHGGALGAFESGLALAGSPKRPAFVHRATAPPAASFASPGEGRPRASTSGSGSGSSFRSADPRAGALPSSLSTNTIGAAAAAASANGAAGGGETIGKKGRRARMSSVGNSVSSISTATFSSIGLPAFLSGRNKSSADVLAQQALTAGTAAAGEGSGAAGTETPRAGGARAIGETAAFVGAGGTSYSDQPKDGAQSSEGFAKGSINKGSAWAKGLLGMKDKRAAGFADIPDASALAAQQVETSSPEEEERKRKMLEDVVSLERQASLTMGSRGRKRVSSGGGQLNQLDAGMQRRGTQHSTDGSHAESDMLHHSEDQHFGHVTRQHRWASFGGGMDSLQNSSGGGEGAYLFHEGGAGLLRTMTPASITGIGAYRADTPGSALGFRAGSPGSFSFDSSIGRASPHMHSTASASSFQQNFSIQPASPHHHHDQHHHGGGGGPMVVAPVGIRPDFTGESTMSGASNPFAESGQHNYNYLSPASPAPDEYHGAAGGGSGAAPGLRAFSPALSAEGDSDGLLASLRAKEALEAQKGTVPGAGSKAGGSPIREKKNGKENGSAQPASGAAGGGSGGQASVPPPPPPPPAASALKKIAPPIPSFPGRKDKGIKLP